MTTVQSSNAVVQGQTVQVCIDGVMSVFQRRMRNLLDERGIEQPDPKPDEWYDLDKFITVLEAIRDDTGANALKKIGEATPEFIEWGADIDSPESALDSLTTIFETVHQGVNEEMVFEQTGEQQGKITSSTLYPQEYQEGFIKGTCEKFGSTHTRISVSEKSANQVIYKVNW